MPDHFFRHCHTGLISTVIFANQSIGEILFHYHYLEEIDLSGEGIPRQKYSSKINGDKLSRTHIYKNK